MLLLLLMMMMTIMIYSNLLICQLYHKKVTQRSQMSRTLREMVAEPVSDFSIGFCLPRDCLMICYEKYHDVYPGMEVKSKWREVIFCRFRLIMSCCSRCALQTSSNSRTWEMVRNAHSQPLPQTHRPESAFSQDPQWFISPLKGKHCYNTTQHGSKIQISETAFRVRGAWIPTLSLPVAGWDLGQVLKY